MTLDVFEPSAADRDALVELARGHRYADYEEYRHYELGFAAELHAQRVRAFLEELEPGSIVLGARCEGELVGFAAARRLAWESGHFGVPMGQISHLTLRGRSPERAERGGRLLSELVAASAAAGLEHLSLRFDTRDLPGLEAAQTCGFRMMDTIVTYLGEARPPRSDWVAERYPDFTWFSVADDTLKGFDLARVAHLEDFMRTGFRNDRFHADRRLGPEKADALYVEWFHKVFRGEWATGIQLIAKADRIVGFCSFQEDEAVTELAGVRIIGRGLAAVLPEGRGGYALLTENICTRCPLGSRFQEFDTQIQNLPVINVWVRRGMPFLRARHTLHAWLDA